RLWRVGWEDAECVPVAAAVETRRRAAGSIRYVADGGRIADTAIQRNAWRAREASCRRIHDDEPWRIGTDLVVLPETRRVVRASGALARRSGIVRSLRSGTAA